MNEMLKAMLKKCCDAAPDPAGNCPIHHPCRGFILLLTRQQTNLMLMTGIGQMLIRVTMHQGGNIEFERNDHTMFTYHQTQLKETLELSLDAVILNVHVRFGALELEIKSDLIDFNNEFVSLERLVK
jgi:hypothetical protein